MTNNTATASATVSVPVVTLATLTLIVGKVAGWSWAVELPWWFVITGPFLVSLGVILAVLAVFGLGFGIVFGVMWLVEWWGDRKIRKQRAENSRRMAERRENEARFNRTWKS